MTPHQWLALETSTDTLSLAVARGAHTWTHTSAGGALTSTHMIPQALALLQEAGLPLADLHAVVFGRGPGAFTGLRTACSVAQGLAFGANLPVLPIDTLLAVAEEARAAHAASGAVPVTRVLAVMDARMEQVYAAAYEFTPNAAAENPTPAGEPHLLQGTWRCVQAPELHSPESLHWPADWAADGFIAAGNAWSVYARALARGTAGATTHGLAHRGSVGALSARGVGCGCCCAARRSAAALHPRQSGANHGRAHADQSASRTACGHAGFIDNSSLTLCHPR